MNMLWRFQWECTEVCSCEEHTSSSSYSILGAVQGACSWSWYHYCAATRNGFLIIVRMEGAGIIIANFAVESRTRRFRSRREWKNFIVMHHVAPTYIRQEFFVYNTFEMYKFKKEHLYCLYITKDCCLEMCNNIFSVKLCLLYYSGSRKM